MFLLEVSVVDSGCSCMLVGRVCMLFSVVFRWLLMNIRCGVGMLFSSVVFSVGFCSGVVVNVWCFSWCSEVYF